MLPEVVDVLNNPYARPEPALETVLTEQSRTFVKVPMLGAPMPQTAALVEPPTEVMLHPMMTSAPMPVTAPAEAA